MKKEDEIKRELAAAIENYENFKKEGKKEEARQALERVQALTGELNEVRVLEAARKEAAAKNMSEKEKKEINRFSFRHSVRVMMKYSQLQFQLKRYYQFYH